MSVVDYFSKLIPRSISDPARRVVTGFRIRDLGLPNRTGVEIAVYSMGQIANGGLTLALGCMAGTDCADAAVLTRHSMRSKSVVRGGSSGGDNCEEHQDGHKQGCNTFFHCNTLPFSCQIFLGTWGGNAETYLC